MRSSAPISRKGSTVARQTRCRRHGERAHPQLPAHPGAGLRPGLLCQQLGLTKPRGGSLRGCALHQPGHRLHAVHGEGGWPDHHLRGQNREDRLPVFAGEVGPYPEPSVRIAQRAQLLEFLGTDVAVLAVGRDRGSLGHGPPALRSPTRPVAETPTVARKRPFALE